MNHGREQEFASTLHPSRTLAYALGFPTWKEGYTAQQQQHLYMESKDTLYACFQPATSWILTKQHLLFLFKAVKTNSKR